MKGRFSFYKNEKNMRKTLLFVAGILISVLTMAQNRPDPKPAADTFEKFKVAMAGYTFAKFDLDKTLETMQQHRRTDCGFSCQIAVERCYGICCRAYLHAVERGN
jgi:hypothetical protein